MKRKIFSVLLTLVLVLSFSMVTAAPVGAVDASVYLHSETYGEGENTVDVTIEDTGDGWLQWTYAPISGAIAAMTVSINYGTADVFEVFTDDGHGWNPGWQCGDSSDPSTVKPVEEVAWVEASGLVVRIQKSFLGLTFKWHGFANINGTGLWIEIGPDLEWHPTGSIKLLVLNENTNINYQTIQAAIDSASPNDTITVAAGTYTENIDVNKHVKIIGAGSGDEGTVITQTGGAGGVVQLSASGISEADPLLFQNLRVEPIGKAGFSVGTFTVPTKTTVSYIKLDNVKVIGTNLGPQYEQERGFYVDLTSTVNNLVVSNCSFDNLTYGWYLQKQVSNDTSTVKNVVVTDTTFNHNRLKGIYAEKLSEATFTRCTASGNGFSAEDVPIGFLPWMCGIDINLKAGTYQNITFSDCTVTNNALGGAKEGVGLTVKGRGTGNDASYVDFPAYVDNVQIIGGTFTGNERGIRFGEPGKENASPANVKVSNANISGNVQTYTGTDGSEYGGLINMTTVEIDATDNWWGHASGPHASPGLGDTISGNVLYNPWLLEPKGATYDKTLALKDGWTLVSTDKAVASSAWVGTEEIAVGLSETISALKYDLSPIIGFVKAAPADLGPLTAIYVKTLGGGGVGINYAEDGPGVMYSKDLASGWNLISIPGTTAGLNDILSPLRYVTAGTQQIVGLTTLVNQGDYNFGESFYLATLTEADWTALAGKTLSPFDGYWAYMEAADTLEVPQ